MADLLTVGLKLFLAYQDLKRKAQQPIQEGTVYQTVTDKDTALQELKNKAGSVSVLIGTRDTGKCVDVNTPITLSNGIIINAGDCVKGQIIMALNLNKMKIVSTKILETANLGLQKCLKITTKSGKEIITTPEHPYYTLFGWIPIEKLRIGNSIAVAHKSSINAIIYKKQNLMISDIYWDEITSITETEKVVCDLMTDEQNFLANDIIVHNTTLARRLAEFFGRPTYAISPQQQTPPGITRINFQDIEELVPENSTLILDDLPAYASNRDYNDDLVKTLNRIIPMVRHERQPPEFPVGKVHLIFCTQSSAQADKFILDCDAAFFKPVGLLIEERPNVARIYKQYVDLEFENKDSLWIKSHAYLMTPTWRGVIKISIPGKEYL